MKKLLLALFLVGCGGSEDVEMASWDLWINHGLPESCHGLLTVTLGDPVTGAWECGGKGIVSGHANRGSLQLFLEPTYNIAASIRDYDGAIIGATADRRPVVGYRQ